VESDSRYKTNCGIEGKIENKMKAEKED